MQQTAPLFPHATAPGLLRAKRIAVLGSARGLGLAVAQAAEAAGAEVHGIDNERRFEGLAAFYQADISDASALSAVAAALPEGLNGLVACPDLDALAPKETLVLGLLAPRVLSEAVAPRMAQGASLVLRGAPLTPQWTEHLSEIRAAMALRHEDAGEFVTRWGLHLDPARTVRTVGWGLLAWVMAHRWRHAARDIRMNVFSPASPNGRLPPEIVSARSHDAATGITDAAQAALFLLSDMSRGMTGANLAVDGGMSAQALCRADGI